MTTTFNIHANTIGQAGKIKNEKIFLNQYSEETVSNFFEKEKENIKFSIEKIESKNEEEKEDSISYLTRIKDFYEEHKGKIKGAVAFTAYLKYIGIPIPDELIEKLEKLLDSE